MTRFLPIVLYCLAAILSGCSTGDSAKGVEARSLLTGDAFAPLPLSTDKRVAYESNLAAARGAYDADPQGEDNIVWLGRRLSYLGRYGEAIDVYSRGLSIHPDSVKLLRHRGHRYISTRSFDRALRDLQRAEGIIRARDLPDEIEPDGMPNARNQPRSTLHDNVYYHLALAHYLQGNFAKAAEVWRTGLEHATPNDDMLVAYTYWLFLAESRAGMSDRAAGRLAALPPSLDIIENHAYERLLRIYKGDGSMTEEQALSAAAESDTDRATTLYGLGTFARLRANEVRARELWRQCLDTGQWPAFGFIAAEVEFTRIRHDSPREFRKMDESLRDIQRERQRSQ